MSRNNVTKLVLPPAPTYEALGHAFMDIEGDISDLVRSAKIAALMSDTTILQPSDEAASLSDFAVMEMEKRAIALLARWGELHKAASSEGGAS